MNICRTVELLDCFSTRFADFFRTIIEGRDFLATALSQMPRLRSLALNIDSLDRFTKAEIHSTVISAILSTPHLREFRIACPFFTHEVPLHIHRQLKIPPLTRFTYLQATYAAYPRAAPPQSGLLTLVLEQVPETLQEL